MLVMLQLACGSPLMDTMTIVPTLQEALADTSGLPITPGQLTSHGALSIIYVSVGMLLMYHLHVSKRFSTKPSIITLYPMI